MTDMAQKAVWYIRRGGDVRGPFPPGQISRDSLLGRIRPRDELSPDRRVWRELRLLPGLVPEIMRLPSTPENHERLMLARLRVDERLHDRRRIHGTYRGMERRLGDRRNVESFAAEEFQARPATDADREGSAERNLLLPAAITLTMIFTLAMYFFWYRPDVRVPVRDCQAASAPAVNWSGCDLAGRQLAGVDLREANLANAVLSRADLSQATLLRADLSYTDLEATNLREANLREARLRGAVLRGANLSGVDLRDADLGNAILEGANLDRTNLEGARLDLVIWRDGRVCAPDSIGSCR